MKKSLGSKRKFIDDSQREQLLHTYQNFEDNEHSKIFENEYFGYTKITIEQPKVENGEVVRDKKGNPKSDSKSSVLRIDFKNTGGIGVKPYDYFTRQLIGLFTQSRL